MKEKRRRWLVVGDGKLQKKIEKHKLWIAEAKRDFYKVWNEAYGSAAQQGLDIYNKWYLKWLGSAEE